MNERQSEIDALEKQIRDMEKMKQGKEAQLAELNQLVSDFKERRNRLLHKKKKLQAETKNPEQNAKFNQVSSEFNYVDKEAGSIQNKTYPLKADVNHFASEIPRLQGILNGLKRDLKKPMSPKLEPVNRFM